MTRLTKILAGSAIAAAAIAGSATAAGAQAYPYPYGERDDYRARDGISVGDIAAGVAAVGAIAGMVNAVTGRGGYYGGTPYGYGAQPYGYGAQSYGYPQRYGYGYPQGNAYGYGNAYGGAYGYGAGAAVNSCGAEAQRFARGGQVQVRDVDQVSGGRFRVRGTYQELGHDRYGRIRAERERFSCLAYGDGRIQDFDS